MVDFRPTSNCDFYKEDVFNVNKNNNRQIVKNKIANNNNDQEEVNNQNNDRNYIKK